jgi:hypothetical protein
MGLLRRVSDDGSVCVVQRREPLRSAARIQSNHVGGGQPILDAYAEFNSLIALATYAPAMSPAAG